MADILTAQPVRTIIPDNTPFQSASIDKSDHIFQWGALYDNTPPAITDGSVGIVRMDSSRRLMVSGTGGKNEDSVHVSGDSGEFVLSIRMDTLGDAAKLAGSDGDYQALLTDSSGALYTKMVGNYNGTDVEISVNPSGAMAISGSITATSNSEYAEDSVHTSGNMGTFVLGVRNDAGTTLAANGDYIPFTMDSTGRLRVDAEFTAAFDYAEDSAHTSGHEGAFILVIRSNLNDPANLAGSNGDYQGILADQAGALYTKMVGNYNGTDVEMAVNASGSLNVNVISGGGGNSEYAEDSVHTSGNMGTFVLGVRNDAGIALAADGDYIPFTMDSTGRLRVDAEFTAAFDYAEDSAHVSGHEGAFVLTVRSNLNDPANLAGSNGDYQAFLTDQAGALYTKMVGDNNGTSVEVAVDSSGNMLVSEGVVTTNAVNDFDDFGGTAVAASTTEIINSVTGSGSNNLFVKNIMVSSSGGPVKVIITTNSTDVEAVAFYPAATLSVNIPFPQPLYVPNGITLDVKAENLAGTAQSIYATVNGFES